jgi:hypothetical protein
MRVGTGQGQKRVMDGSTEQRIKNKRDREEAAVEGAVTVAGAVSVELVERVIVGAVVRGFEAGSGVGVSASGEPDGWRSGRRVGMMTVPGVRSDADDDPR